MVKIAVNIGHSATRYGAEDAINPAEGDTRWTREAYDNALLAGVVVQKLSANLVYEIGLFAQQGSESLTSLCARVKKWEPTLFISLHRNSATNPKATGWSVWYHGNDFDGRRFAFAIADELKKISDIWADPAGAVRSDYEIYPPKEGKDRGFYVLRTFPKNGILFEGGFISNPKDEVWYDNPKILTGIAEAFDRGIKAFVPGIGGWGI